ncbi:CTP synthase [Allobaculum sp. JKK-2023]|uniref:CTP synthase n=1 Tax=Allobaculum sp. JKK-2023 TaxID=3108943 RepID=UPI002B051B73|nr:CTP synthase [Allobaculum sp. JKK-2023]
MKYIFVTGGVVSGLGKGITAASIGRLLKARGYKVTAQKLDPYINVDPGTMSPYQHGEVFVTDDGLEADLDLGHYERFIDENLHQYSNLTTGKVYWNVLNKEREGKYLGQTVQVIPHITDEIKNFVMSAGTVANADVVITEIGGTIGDIESQPFLESIRQVAQEAGRGNCLFVHVTYIPYISGSKEFKSKPTQHSVKELQSFGIHPDLIIARCDETIPKSVLDKISLFCNVEPSSVFENRTLESLYEVPLMLEDQDIAKVVCDKLSLPYREPDLNDWRELVSRIKSANQKVTIGLVGKYVQLHDAYLSVAEALAHGSFENGVDLTIKWIDSEHLDNLDEVFADVDGIIVPGGFGGRGIEGMIAAAGYARTHKIPYLGICLGMQIAAISFARDALGYSDANSFEFDETSEHPIIDFMVNQSNEIKKGGTMRLGAYPCYIHDNTLLHNLYQADHTRERHRHRYEFNNLYRREFEEHGMKISGTSPDFSLVEAIEYTDHPFYVGVQYHPEFRSRPNRPHPLFAGLVKASLENAKRKEDEHVLEEVLETAVL